MSEPVSLNPSASHDTVLPQPDDGLMERLATATDRTQIADLVAAHPESIEAWAELAEAAAAGAESVAERLEAYAYFRIGYHRGLDALRKHGWRGAGHVRWSQPSNRGFLRCLDGLGSMAALIHEHDEAARCGEFLRQLDPDWPPPGR